eukprot:TRINITY_DN6683_c1_g1_i7.p1 TRINITY_DN6683_c1_g1~~TRINITY_DN6683_c1_g1_i7.p1  ORF type:complete len:247 (-),score=-27.24 TRINITY_DN6683_c1_g1_i7:668-1408(-)
MLFFFHLPTFFFLLDLGFFLFLIQFLSMLVKWRQKLRTQQFCDVNLKIFLNMNCLVMIVENLQMEQLLCIITKKKQYILFCLRKIKENFQQILQNVLNVRNAFQTKALIQLALQLYVLLIRISYLYINSTKKKILDQLLYTWSVQSVVQQIFLSQKKIFFEKINTLRIVQDVRIQYIISVCFIKIIYILKIFLTYYKKSIIRIIFQFLYQFFLHKNVIFITLITFDLIMNTSMLIGFITIYKYKKL